MPYHRGREEEVGSPERGGHRVIWEGGRRRAISPYATLAQTGRLGIQWDTQGGGRPSSDLVIARDRVIGKPRRLDRCPWSAAEQILRLTKGRDPDQRGASSAQDGAIRHFASEGRSPALHESRLDQVALFDFQILVHQRSGQAAGGDFKSQRALVAHLADQGFAAVAH